MHLRPFGAAVLACALALAATAAEARTHHKPAHSRALADDHCEHTDSGRVICRAGETRMGGIASGRAGHKRNAYTSDPRPRAWCGWWMRQYLGVADRAGNLARWWARFGTNAHGPAVGALVVWRHHVGIITGKGMAGWIVKSGNDGHAVRERERSLRGAIAFRWPERWASR